MCKGIMAGTEDSFQTGKKFDKNQLDILLFLKHFMVKAQLIPPSLAPHQELSINPIPLKMVFKRADFL